MEPTISKVWRFFSKLNDTDVNCQLCQKQLKYCKNTTNMLQHFKLKHTKEFESLKLPNIDNEHSEAEGDSMAMVSTISQPKVHMQQSIQSAFLNVHSFASGGPKHTEMTKSNVEMLAMDTS